MLLYAILIENENNMPNNPSTLQNRSSKIIGRFANLRPEIDPSDRVSNELTDKMSIVDLIPCSFNIGYGSKMPDFNIESMTKELLNLITPTLIFEEPIEAYREACEFYGLIPVDYLKVYLTDMSTGVDQITNTYDKNLISSTLESEIVLPLTLTFTVILSPPLPLFLSAGTTASPLCNWYSPVDGT